jgi:hypothetical protein
VAGGSWSFNPSLLGRARACVAEERQHKEIICRCCVILAVLEVLVTKLQLIQ